MEIEDYNLVIDSSNIPEIAKFIASSSTNAYISIIPNNNPSNCARIGVESNNMYFGIVTNNNSKKILELNNNNLISHNDLIPSYSTLNLGSSLYSYSNIYCNTIYANNVILYDTFNLDLQYTITNNYSDKNSILYIPFTPIQNTLLTWNNTTNCFTAPYSGLYSINYSVYLNNNTINNNTNIFINKSSATIITYQNNNRYGCQYINTGLFNNCCSTSITILLNKNDTIYFCLTVTPNYPQNIQISEYLPIIINPINANNNYTTASIKLLYMTN
jgi:hypothetical protein